MAGHCAYCDSLTAAGYTLETNYADNFKVNNEQSRENIFTIVTDKTLYPSLFKNLFRRATMCAVERSAVAEKTAVVQPHPRSMRTAMARVEKIAASR